VNILTKKSAVAKSWHNYYPEIKLFCRNWRTTVASWWAVCSWFRDL